ncbi:MAG: nuclear transport factor 2 family protein [Alphaproteobacteria bacterium]|nr:nuclear transport factor 2 family protein [Alphaproteobacteria bacterium]
MTVDDLLEIERIRKIRMLYSYYLDAGEIDALAALFSADAVCEFGPFGVWTGQATIAENYHKVMGPMLSKGPFHSLHVNTNHWVELTGPASAVGRLYLVDLALDRAPEENPLLWLGAYDEAYVKVSGDWKIQRTSLHFMWPQRHITGDFPGNHLPVSS